MWLKETSAENESFVFTIWYVKYSKKKRLDNIWYTFNSSSSE